MVLLLLGAFIFGFNFHPGNGFVLDGHCTGLLPVCPLFRPMSNVISPSAAKRIFADSSEWVNVYTYEILSDDMYGKCTYNFSRPDANGVTTRRSACYNLSTKQCENYLESMTIKTGGCGAAMLESEPGLDNETTMFYSQDPNTYLWLDICEDPTPSGDCGQRYFDLLVKASVIKNGEADLSGLPLDMIAVDLTSVMNKRFGEKDIRFTWLNTECPL